MSEVKIRYRKNEDVLVKKETCKFHAFYMRSAAMLHIDLKLTDSLLEKYDCDLYDSFMFA